MTDDRFHDINRRLTAMVPDQAEKRIAGLESDLEQARAELAMAKKVIEAAREHYLDCPVEDDFCKVLTEWDERHK